jgi:hypothetical protein
MSRPAKHLIAALRGYSDLSKHIDTFRQSKGKDLPNWRDYCFLPMAAWYSIVSNKYNTDRLNVEKMQELQDVASAGSKNRC